MLEKTKNLIDRSSEARRQGDRAAAYDLARCASEASRAADDLDGLGVALAALGRLHRDDHEQEEAVALYEDAVDLARRTGDDLALAHRLRHIGDIIAELGNLTRAEQCLEEAEELLARQAPDELTLANFLRSRALLKEKQDDCEGAAELWTRARGLYAANGIHEGVRESDRRLAGLRRPG